MTDEGAVGFGSRVQARLEERSAELARRWLDALLARLPESPRRIFPTRTLLDQIPLVIRRIAQAAGSEQPVLEDQQVRGDLREVAKLRRSQGYAADELVRELELLGSILFAEVLEMARGEETVSVEEGLVVARRLQEAIDQVSLYTVRVFRQETTSDRLERAHLLHGFGRAVTHELRNRLNVILLNLRRLRLERQAPAPLEGELLDKLEAEIRGVEEVVGDVFLVAIAHGPADPVEERRRPLAELVDSVVADFEEMAVDQGVRIEVDHQGLPPVEVDATRVQLVLINLIANAVKYMDTDKPDRWVRISGRRMDEEGGWRVEVADNGIGIPPAEAAAIFERHARGSNRKDQTGLGLGLFLAREAVQQLGGRLWVESSPGEGSRFFFLLPDPREEL